MKKGLIVCIVIGVISIAAIGMIYYRDTQDVLEHIVDSSLFEIGYQLNDAVEDLSKETNSKTIGNIERRTGSSCFEFAENIYYISIQQSAGKWKEYDVSDLAGWLYKIHTKELSKKETSIIKTQIETLNEEYKGIVDALKDTEDMYNYTDDPKGIRQKLKRINSICAEYRQELN